jgi:molybdate transport system regulatory protein
LWRSEFLFDKLKGVVVVIEQFEKRLDEAICFYKYIVMKINSEQKKTHYQWRGRVWLEGNEDTFLGYGRVILLERIRDSGSLAQAARSMEMSYKHAWDLLNSMNIQAGCRLVESVRGGKNGGGARLTPAGERAIKLFWEYHARFNAVLEEMTIQFAERLQVKKDSENRISRCK